MRLRRVAVLGGGPGGLYAARLMKLAQPECDVVVYEQGVPDKTFGFGVGLAAGTQRNLAAADPDSLRDIVADGYRHDMQMRVRGRTTTVHSDALIGVARTGLLAVLQQHAERSGVVLKFGERQQVEDLDADLVIAADGVNSATRAARSDAFGATVDQGGALYLWAATDFALENAIFEPVETEYGTFVTHAYPYCADRSTFLVEIDEETWRRAGLDADYGRLAPDASDERSLRYLEQVFSDVLQGHPLIGNRTQWLRFRTVHAARWHAEQRGAARRRRAHRPLLDRVRHQAGDGGRHRARRRPGRRRRPARRAEHVRGAAPSGRGTAAGAGPPQPALVGQLPRAPRPAGRPAHGGVHVPGRERPAGTLRAEQPGRRPPGAHGLRGERAGGPRRTGRRRRGCSTGHCASGTAPSTPGGWTPRRSRRYADEDSAGAGTVARLQVDAGNAWSPAGDAVVERARRLAAVGCAGIWLVGPDDRDAVLDRLDLGERIRRATGLLTIAAVPEEYRADAAAALVSARVDLVDLTRDHD